MTTKIGFPIRVNLIIYVQYWSWIVNVPLFLFFFGLLAVSQRFLRHAQVWLARHGGFSKGFFYEVQSSEQHFVSFSLDFQNQMLNFFLSHSLTYFCFQASSWSFPSSFFVFETCESRYMLGCFLIHFITCLVVWLQRCLVEIKKWLLKIKSSCLHEPSLCSLFAQMIAILLSLHMPKVGPKHQTYFQCPVKLPREPKESSSL